MPTSLVGALSSPVTGPVISSAWRDLLQHRCPDDDESVDECIGRHFGRQAASLAGAVVGGIFAGDSRDLSVRSVFPALWDLQQRHGSLVLAALSGLLHRQTARTAAGGSASAGLVSRFSSYLDSNASPFVRDCARATSVSFTHGITTLTHALEEALLREGADGPPEPESYPGAPWLAQWPPPQRTALLESERPGWLQRSTEALPRSRTARSALGCEVEVRTGATVRVLAPLHHNGDDVRASAEGVAVHVDDDASGSHWTVITADYAVSTLPAAALAAVLRASRRVIDGGGPRTLGRDALEPTAITLDAIPTASVATVNLGYCASPGMSTPVKPSTLRGFGYLIPASERSWATSPAAAVAGADRGRRHAVLGATFDSDVFPDQTMSGRAGSGALDSRLTVMIGGATWPEVADCTEAELTRLALQAAHAHVGVTETPREIVVNVARNAIPQYTLGHHSRVAAVESGIEELFDGRVRVIGNSFRGVGISDCLTSAIAAAEHVLARMTPAIQRP